MSSATPKITPTPKENKTLSDFIDENQKVLSVIGFFTALGIFWSKVLDDEFSSWVSFLCFLVTLPLFFEVQRNLFKNESKSISKILFSNIFFLIFLNTIFYLFIGFPNYREWLITFILFLTLVLILDYRLEKWRNHTAEKDIQKANSDLDEFKKLVADNKDMSHEEKQSRIQQYLEILQSGVERRHSFKELLSIYIHLGFFLIGGFFVFKISKILDTLIFSYVEKVDIQSLVPPIF